MHWFPLLLCLLLGLATPSWGQAGRALNQETAGIINPLRYGSTCSSTTLSAAISGAPSTLRRLLLPPIDRAGVACTWIISSNLTVPSDMTLDVAPGATLSINAGVTLTIGGGLDAAPQPLFSGSGSVVFSGGHRVAALYPQWWGAKGDGTTNDTTAMNAALTAANAAGGSLVRLTQGTFLISTALLVGNGTTLEGVGPSSVLKMSSGMTTRAIIGRDGTTGQHDIRLAHLTIQGARNTPAGAWTSWRNFWAPSSAYPNGFYLFAQASGNVYIQASGSPCTSAGTGSGPSGTGTGISDGTCSWNFVEPMWTPGVDGVFFTKSRNMVFDGLTIHSHKNDGLICEFCDDVQIINTHTYDNNKDGLYCSGCERATIAHNTSRHEFGGIAAQSCWYCTVMGNVGRSNIQASILTGRDTRFSAFTGNTGEVFLVSPESLTGYLHGQTYAGSPGDTFYGISNSTISSNTMSSYYLQLSHNNVIADNVARPWIAYVFEAQDDTQRGIPAFYLHGCSGNLVVSNRVYNGGSSTQPWAFLNDRMPAAETGATQGNIDSTNNRYLHNYVLDDRASGERQGISIDANSTNIILRGNNVSLASNKTSDVQYYNYTLTSISEFADNVKNNTDRFLLAGGPPTASVRRRGDFFPLAGGAGVADQLYVTQKNASDAYVNNLVLTATQIVGGSLGWNPPDLAPGEADSAAVTVTGAAVGDYCWGTLDTDTSFKTQLTCHPQSASTVWCVYQNANNPGSGANVDAGNGTLKVYCIRTN